MESEFFWVERDTARSVEDTVALVEEHFGWRPLKNFEIRKVEKDTAFAAEFFLTWRIARGVRFETIWQD